MLRPGKTGYLQAIIWGNFRAHLFVSFLSGVAVIICLLSSEKLCFIDFVQFSSCLKQEGKPSPCYFIMARSLHPNFTLFLLEYSLSPSLLVLSIFQHVQVSSVTKTVKEKKAQIFFICQSLLYLFQSNFLKMVFLPLLLRFCLWTCRINITFLYVRNVDSQASL